MSDSHVCDVKKMNRKAEQYNILIQEEQLNDSKEQENITQDERSEGEKEQIDQKDEEEYSIQRAQAQEKHQVYPYSHTG